MTPNVFLSLSGKDVEFAKQVWEALPRGLAYFYQESFETGEALLKAMEQGVGRAQIFVLLASRDALNSPWVGFELTKARVRQISDQIQVYAFPIEDGLKTGDFPEWMRDYWIGPSRWGPRDIARFVQDKLIESHLSPNPEASRVVGRGALVDQATREIVEKTADTGRSPNVLIFAGSSQIGRRTFAKFLLRQCFTALPNVAVGPELRLPQFSDIADVYRALRENIDVGVQAKDVEESLSQFSSFNEEDQISEVVTSLSYFARLGQAVFVATGSGLFDDIGNVKPWLASLFRAVRDRPEIILCFVTNRRFREEFLMEHENVLQVHVPALSDADTRALITLVSNLYAIEPVRFGAVIVRAIGGHPSIAKAAVRLVVNKGVDVLERNPHPLFGIQDGILSQNLDLDALTQVQQELLSVLSWVPMLSGNLLLKLVEARHDNAEDEFIGAIEDLILSCLIVVHGDQYAISSEIREMYRRKYGYGDDKLVADFSGVLAEAWRDSEQKGAFRSDLFDAFVYMHALAGKTLPKDLRQLLLPATLEEIVRRTYAQGRDDRAMLEKVVEWGSIAHEMKMDETVREAILTTVIQAQIRLRQFGKAEEGLRLFAARGYRSTPFLRGFFYRRQGKLADAIPHLREAIAAGKNRRYSVQELATVYQRLGRTDELAKLVQDHEHLIEESAVLLDFRIGMYITARQFAEATAAIERLGQLPEDEGRSTIRRAQLAFQRDGDPKEALELLNELVRAGVGSPTMVRRWRGMVAAYANDEETARRDIEFLAARNGQEATAQRLKVHLGLARKDSHFAEEAFEGLHQNSAHDRLLRAHILDLKAQEAGLTLAERTALRDEAAALRVVSRGASEYEL